MRIVINTRFLFNEYPADFGCYNMEVFNKVIKNNPGHEFLFIISESYAHTLTPANNAKAILVKDNVRNTLLWPFWYTIRIPRLLKKHKADLFIAADGGCFLKTKTPQLIIIHNPLFFSEGSAIKKSQLNFFKRNHKKFIEKAEAIVTTSVFSKEWLKRQFPVNEQKIHVITGAVDELYKPLNRDEKNSIKEKYADGKEYFLYFSEKDTMDNIIHLLKAFSGFKKRQQSQMKLMIAGSINDKQVFEKKLTAYKYNEDVVVNSNPDNTELAKLIASSYCYIDKLKNMGVGLNVMNAMQCATPVITNDAELMKEVTQGNALYADFTNYKSIAEQMMRLYKDENTRNKLADAGKNSMGVKSWDHSARNFWEAVEKTVG